jgi:hypothetical protein
VWAIDVSKQVFGTAPRPQPIEQGFVLAAGFARSSKIGAARSASPPERSHVCRRAKRNKRTLISHHIRADEQSQLVNADLEHCQVKRDPVSSIHEAEGRPGGVNRGVDKPV